MPPGEMTISMAIKNEFAGIIAKALSGGRIDLYSGSMPEFPEDGAVGDLIATANFAEVAFDEPAAGGMDSRPLIDGAVFRESEVTWGRLFRADGVSVLDVPMSLQCKPEGGFPLKYFRWG